MKFYLRTFWQVFKFIFFPSLIRQKEKAEVVSGVSIDFKKDRLPLIISFAGLGEQFNFGNTLKDIEANVIYLRDVNHNWYLNGLEGVGDSVKEVTSFLRHKVEEYKALTVVTIGTSAGGFGAILYGHLLKASSVVAFSPQTFMNRWNCIRYLDYRWLDRVVQIYQGSVSNRGYLDLKWLIHNDKIAITLVYDKTHRLDAVHASRMQGATIKHLAQSGGGHTLVRGLKNSGVLGDLIKYSLQSK